MAAHALGEGTADITPAPTPISDAARAEAEVANLQEVVRIHSAACIRAGIRASHAESLRDDMEAERDAALAREARLREALRIIAHGQGWQRDHAEDALASTIEPQPAAEGER